MHEEKLGQELASKLRWDGVGILLVAKAALTDANFHAEALVIEQLISNNMTS